MLFALMCSDKPDHLDIRLATRPAHLNYLESLGDDLILAGPTLDDAGKPNGSIVVVRAADKDKAAAIAAGDPYAAAGLFADVRVTAWNWAVKRPEGMRD